MTRIILYIAVVGLMGWLFFWEGFAFGAADAMGRIG